jgi:hypothetical protein
VADTRGHASSTGYAGEDKSLCQVTEVVDVSERAIRKQLRRLGWPFGSFTPTSGASCASSVHLGTRYVYRLRARPGPNASSFLVTYLAENLLSRTKRCLMAAWPTASSFEEALVTVKVLVGRVGSAENAENAESAEQQGPQVQVLPMYQHRHLAC